MCLETEKQLGRFQELSFLPRTLLEIRLQIIADMEKENPGNIVIFLSKTSSYTEL